MKHLFIVIILASSVCVSCIKFHYQSWGELYVYNQSDMEIFVETNVPYQPGQSSTTKAYGVRPGGGYSIIFAKKYTEEFKKYGYSPSAFMQWFLTDYPEARIDVYLYKPSAPPELIASYPISEEIIDYVEPYTEIDGTKLYYYILTWNGSGFVTKE